MLLKEREREGVAILSEASPEFPLLLKEREREGRLGASQSSLKRVLNSHASLA